MRKNVPIDYDLHTEAKAKSATIGMSLQDFVEEAIKKHLEEQKNE